VTDVKRVTLRFPPDTTFPLVGRVWDVSSEGEWDEVQGPAWRREEDGSIIATYSLGMLRALKRSIEMFEPRPPQTWDDIVREARRRDRSHRGDKSSRPLSTNYELIGLAGEWTFGQCYGYRVDLEPRRRGDEGVDFRTPAGIVDVKTYRRSVHLWLEERDRRTKAEVLVLMKYHDESPQNCDFVGWELVDVMRSARIVETPARIYARQKPAAELRPMEEFNLRMDEAMESLVPRWTGPRDSPGGL
jgi:hypothetical protein